MLTEKELEKYVENMTSDDDTERDDEHPSEADTSEIDDFRENDSKSDSDTDSDDSMRMRTTYSSPNLCEIILLQITSAPHSYSKGLGEIIIESTNVLLILQG